MKKEELITEKTVSFFGAKPLLIIILSIISFGMVLVMIGLFYIIIKMLEKAHDDPVLPTIQVYQDHFRYAHKMNLVQHKETVVQIKDIKGITIENNFGQAIFGFGNLKIGTAATGGNEIAISGLRNADLKELKDILDKKRKDIENKQYNINASKDKTNKNDLDLRELHALKEDGIISKEEFEKKKKEYLG